MKKWLSLLLILTFMLAIAACSGNNNGNNNAGTTGGNASNTPKETEAAAEENFKDGKYTTPITLSTVWGLNQSSVFKVGETIEDNVHTRLIKERLGIDIKYDWVITNTNDAYKTKLRLMLSSGEKMPDIVVFRGDLETVNMLIDSGQFMPVGDLVDKYANETYKAGLDLDPTIWLPISRGGEKMALPVLDYAYNGDHVMWIRQDWLDKLQLKAPTTIAEMETVMDAFTNQDPDGDGKKNTIGLATGFKNGFANWMTDIGFLFGAYGTIPGQWNLAADGTLEHGSINHAAKKALTKLNEWLNKGYISQDSALFDEVKGSELFTKGEAGIVFGPNWLPAWPFPDLKNNVPGATYKAYPVPAGPDGTIGSQGGNPPSNGYIFVNKDSKNPEAILHYYNWFFDNIANPQPGSEFEKGFAEGYDYATLPDGSITADAAKYPDLFPGLKDQTAPPLYYTLTYEGARIPTLYADTHIKLAGGAEPTTPYEKQEFNTRLKENTDAMKVVMDQVEIRKKNYYMGPLTETMQSKNELLNKLLNETYSKIVYGQQPVDTFDEMVENWKKSGGEQITKEVNDWYNSVK
ncbi:extracellular solute-binding protein [Paenibacillus harenae]|uniref:extracellular solute-binding protein n=1 Tax=Paenibacillus harenae TaxID=306543 RepID=UPI00278ED4BB|nr:extracellular solute-binding protein [Paenibacillus harenae]MDQ0061222.1 putative aldouronate transport system substrate-binding protein [Paenibacillus harenae]